MKNGTTFIHVILRLFTIWRNSFEQICLCILRLNGIPENATNHCQQSSNIADVTQPRYPGENTKKSVIYTPEKSNGKT